MRTGAAEGTRGADRECHVSLGGFACSAAARFLASFLARFSSRRSASARSRFSFAIVVFLLLLEPMHVLLGGISSRSMRRKCAREAGADRVHRALRMPPGLVATHPWAVPS